MLSIALVLTLLASPAEAAGPDGLRPWCGTGPLNPAERTICSTPELARLDARLAGVYGRLRSADPAQDEWLRGRRDGCGMDVACLRAAYIERIRRVGSLDAR